MTDAVSQSTHHRWPSTQAACSRSSTRSPGARRGLRRSDRRRVHLRRDRARLARGAGPDPQLRLDRDRAGRRRQRREQRRRARRRAGRRSASPAATKPGGGCSTSCGARVDVSGVVRPAGYRTPTKTRILAGGVHSAKQQVVRIDRARGRRSRTRSARPIESRVLRAVRRADALLVSDYGTGLVTPALVARARRRLRRRPGRARRSWSTRATPCCGSAA